MVASWTIESEKAAASIPVCPVCRCRVRGRRLRACGGEHDGTENPSRPWSTTTGATPGRYRAFFELLTKV